MAVSRPQQLFRQRRTARAPLFTRQAHGRRAISHPKSSDSAVIRTLPVSPPSHSGGHLTMQEGHLASRIADLRADHHQRVADRRKSVLLNASTTPLGSPPTRRTNPRRTHGSGRPSKSGRPARPASRHMRRPACRSAGRRRRPPTRCSTAWVGVSTSASRPR